MSVCDRADSAAADTVAGADSCLSTLSLQCVAESRLLTSSNCVLVDNKHDYDVGRIDALKRTSRDDTCDIPLKRATAHSCLLSTPTSTRHSAVSSSALCAATLPSFPPTLFSSFPSLGNSRMSSSSSSQCLPVTMSHLPVSMATSTLFSVPVHGVASATRPLLLVPSLPNCVLIPSLCSTPLLYVLNAAPQSHSRPASAASTATVGIPHGAGNLQPNIPHVVQPVGGAISSDQSASSTNNQNSLRALRVPLLSSIQRPVVTSAHNTGNFLPFSVPNIPLLSHSLRPTSTPRQLCTPSATDIGIPRIARNSLPVGLSLPNIAILSHVLRPLGGASVDQSAVRLVSSVNNLRGANVTRLNGIISPRSNALLLPAIIRPSAAANITKPASIAQLSSSSVLISTNYQPNLINSVPHIQSVSSLAGISVSGKSSEYETSSASDMSTHSLLRTILNKQVSSEVMSMKNLSVLCSNNITSSHQSS